MITNKNSRQFKKLVMYILYSIELGAVLRTHVDELRVQPILEEGSIQLFELQVTLNSNNNIKTLDPI